MPPVRQNAVDVAAHRRLTKSRTPNEQTPNQFRSTPADNPLNAVNRSVYISDNPRLLQSMNADSFDLAYIDPLFAKNETFGHKDNN